MISREKVYQKAYEESLLSLRETSKKVLRIYKRNPKIIVGLGLVLGVLTIFSSVIVIELAESQAQLFLSLGLLMGLGIVIRVVSLYVNTGYMIYLDMKRKDQEVKTKEIIQKTNRRAIRVFFRNFQRSVILGLIFGCGLLLQMLFSFTFPIFTGITLVLVIVLYYLLYLIEPIVAFCPEVKHPLSYSKDLIWNPKNKWKSILTLGLCVLIQGVVVLFSREISISGVIIATLMTGIFLPFLATMKVEAFWMLEEGDELSGQVVENRRSLYE